MGYNQFTYCFNNPISLSDSGGTWPTLNGTYSLSRKVMGWVFETYLYDIFENSIVVNQEFVQHIDYFFFYTLSTGVGYNNNFDTGKRINGYILVNNLGAYAVGVDINYNDYGGSIQVGKETSVSLHINTTTHEVGITNSGRLYYQNTYVTESGGYSYWRFSLNGPEIAAFGVAAYYGRSIVIPAASQGLNYALTK